jgi:hypothetical protein
MKIVITESQYRILMENTVEIDQILDKLGEIGYENLENEEKMTLNRYSEWLNSGQKGEFMGEMTPKNDDYDDKTGQKWSKRLADGTTFTFQFEYNESESDVDLYFGTIHWGGKEWSGCIVTEKDGELSLLDFVEDVELESYDVDTEEDPTETKNLVDSLGDLNDEVDYFIEEKVIPSLMG